MTISIALLAAFATLCAAGGLALRTLDTSLRALRFGLYGIAAEALLAIPAVPVLHLLDVLSL